MPNLGRNPDRRGLRPDGSRWRRRLSIALAAPLAIATLLAFDPRPASAQGSTVAVESSSAAKSPHHARRKSAAKAGAERSAAKTGSATDASSDEKDNGFAGLTSSKGPINIQSDTLSLDYKGKSVLFSGHVHAAQSGSQLSSDVLHVNYEQNFKDVKDLTADGNVRITQGARWATSDHAVMNQKSQTVVMTGNPVVHDGPDVITGDRITVHLDTGKSVVEHAHALIFPRQSQTPDNGVSGAAADQSTAADPAAAGANSPGAPVAAPGH